MHSENRNVLRMYWIALLQGLVFYGPIATLYRQVRGVSLYQIALIESVSLALSLLCEIPWGVLSDRIGYKRTLVLSNLIYLLSKLVFWRARSFAGFLTERLLLALALSGLSGCDIAYLHEVTAPQRRIHVFGWYEAACYLGLMAASAIYALALPGRYEAAALLTVMAYVLALALTCRLQEVPLPPSCKRTPWRHTLKALLGDWRFWPFLLGAACLRETAQMLSVFLGQLNYQRLGLPQPLFGIAALLCTCAHLSSLLTARLEARWGTGRVALACCSLALLSCVALLFVHRAALAVAATCLLAGAASMFQPLAQSIMDRRTPSGGRAAMLSGYSALMNLAGAGLNLGFGALGEGNLVAAYALGGLLCLAAPLLCLSALKKERRKPQTAKKAGDPARGSVGPPPSCFSS